MDMRKIEDITKQIDGENSLIEMQYRETICNDCKERPASYFIVRRPERHPDYDEVYICRLCKDKCDRLSVFGLNQQVIVESH